MSINVKLGVDKQREIKIKYKLVYTWFFSTCDLKYAIERKWKQS